jgi:putative ABC transport system ATP-binding protein
MVVRIRDLVVEYRLGGESLRVVDIPAWEVDDAEQVAVAGPSGSGKSTLLHVIAGLMLPTSREANVCDQDLTRLGEAERDRLRAAHIACIFQTFNLLQGYTAIENVLLGAAFGPARADRATAKALLERVGLGARLRHLPAEMSIGEQQRVAVARALVKRPQLALGAALLVSVVSRREALTAADLLEVLREDVANRWLTEEQLRLQEQAKVEWGDGR